MSTKLMTRDEVAADYRVHPKTISRLVKAGKFPKPLRVGRRQVWIRVDIETHLKEQAKQEQEQEA